MSTNFYISVSVLTKYDLTTDADELAFTFKTIEKSTRKKRYIIQKLLEKENPLFTLHVIIRNDIFTALPNLTCLGLQLPRGV